MYERNAKALGVLLAFLVTGQARAQSLRVSPITIDMPPAAGSAVLNVRNDSDKTIAVQARVFVWTQVNGDDKLERTNDVAVSPPLLTVDHKSSAVIRVVRVNQKPVASEECYRIFLDEIPDRAQKQTGRIALVVRQSIPVFFRALDGASGALTWSASTRGDKVILQAANSGTRHIKLTGLQVLDGAAQKLATISGLAGYVLPGRMKTWEVDIPKGGLSGGNSIGIEATSEAGPINASALVRKNG